MGNSVQPRHKAERAEAQVGDVMRFAVILAVLLPTAALADDWVPLDGTAITETLTDQRLKYTAARQHFGADGQTLYDAGRPSWGSWAVRGDQYCSVWPPSDLWTCYDVQQNDDMIRFVASDGSFSDGTLVD
jgi:hypothetical protein